MHIHIESLDDYLLPDSETLRELFMEDATMLDRISPPVLEVEDEQTWEAMYVSGKARHR